MQKIVQYLEGIPPNKKWVLLIVLLSIATVPTLMNLPFSFHSYIPSLNKQLYEVGVTLLIYVTWLSLLYLLIKKDGLRLKHLSLTGSEIRKGLVISLAAFIAVNAALVLRTLLMEESLVVAEKFSSLTRASKTLGLFTFNIFTGAFLEEVLCRAYVIPQVYLLLRNKIKHKATALLLALLLTQLLFALAHLPRDVFRFDLDFGTIIGKQSELLMSGLILSLVYLRTRNVFFLAIFHAFMNYGLPITGTEADFKLFYMLTAFSLALFWVRIMRSDKPGKQLRPALFPGKTA